MAIKKIQVQNNDAQELHDARIANSDITNWNAKYNKPSGGIPKTDLTSSVQASLDLADTAVQAEPVGSVTPAADPYAYATREEVSQLGQKVNGLWETCPNNLGVLLGGSIQGWANCYFKAIPVPGINTIQIINENTGDDINCALVKSYTVPTLSASVSYDFATGEQRRTINANSSMGIEVPADANYLLITSVFSGADITKLSILFDGMDVFNSLLSQESDKRKQLEIMSGVWENKNLLGVLLGGSIQGWANCYFKAIPISGVNTLKIFADESSNCYYTLVKSYVAPSLSGTSAFDFATGETERRMTPANTGQVVSVPSDAKFLLIQSEENGISLKPAAIYFDGSNVTDKLSTQVENNGKSIKSKVDVCLGENLYNGVFQDGAGLGSDGLVMENPAWSNEFRISDKIPFNDNSKIICNHCATGGFYSVIYNENNNIVSIVANTAETQVFENVAGGKYIKISLRSTKNRKYPIVIAYGESLPPSSSEYSPVEGYEPKYRIIYAYGSSGVDDSTHFYGNDAIRKALNSIKDESPTNRYIIKAEGTFIATLPSHYEEYAGSYAMFWPRPYIGIIGVNDCIVKGSLPDSLAECQADTPSFVKAHYGLYQPAFVISGCYIENVTFIARNTRYPLHIEGAASEYAYNMDFIVKYCRLIHEGKFGDAVGTVGGSPSGFGTSSGAKYLFEKCYFEGGENILYAHDNIRFEKINKITFDKCKFNNRERSGREISFPRLLNTIGTDISVINCDFNKYAGVMIAIDGNAENAERVGSFNKGRIKFTGKPKPTAVNLYQENGLRIKAVSDVDVTIDSSSTAFDLIFGYSNEVAYIDFNEYSRHQQYGYVWKNGGNGLPGDAVGLRNIQSSGDYTLGKRLGDCSSVNKTLSVLVDGVSHSIVFSSNYTNVNNDTILAEINSALEGYAVADLYSVASEYYPEYDEMGVETVDDSTAVLRGMGVVFTEDGVRRALSSDVKIDGIALDNGADNDKIRVIYSGFFATKNNLPGNLLLESGISVDSLSFGDELFISESEPGKFSTTGVNKVAIVRVHSAEIIQ